MSPRLQSILKMLEKTPADPFLLYAAAMEHRKAGELEQAVAYFDKTLAADASYCYAYYHRGQALESAGDVAGARETYRRGIEAARTAGDAKALGELTAALDLLA
jgi:tetratricopeptide (TPR) repeat protein